MSSLTRIQKCLPIFSLILLCFLIFAEPSAHARTAFDIVSIDLTVSPNPIPCGGSATATATIQMPADKTDVGALDTTISLWDYDTLFRDGDDELDRKSGLFRITDDKIVVEYTLHCQTKDADCDLYGPSGESGESGTYVFVRVEDSDTKSPRVYVQCKQLDMDGILRLDGVDGPDSPEEPASFYKDNTIFPGNSSVVTLSAQEPLMDIVSGSWTIEFDAASLMPTRVDYVHPDFAGTLQHMIFSDYIAFTFDNPAGSDLDGELLKVYFDALQTPAAEWAPVYVHCGDGGSFHDSGGQPLDICMGGPLSLFIPPMDTEAPKLHPEYIRFGLREITGTAGAATDNRSDLGNYLSVVLYDETHEPVAADFVAPDGSFSLDNVFMLSPQTPSTLMLFDGVGNQDALTFIPSPDLEDALSLLMMLIGMSPGIPLIEDINGDGRIGLEEVVYVLQRVSGKRTAPPLPLAFRDTIIALDPLVDMDNTADDVAPGATIQVEFNRNICDIRQTFPTTGAASFFTILESESGTSVDGTVEVYNRWLTFHPADSLKENMTYWLSVSENVFNLASSLSDPEIFYWSITTQDVSLVPHVDIFSVYHPHPGSIPREYYDVGWEIDGSRNLTLSQVNEMIATAEANARYYNTLVPSDAPGAMSTDKFTCFHFWPNIINLSAVYGNADHPDLFDRILEDLLQYTENPSTVKGQLTADISAGDRVFIARDFIDKIIYNFTSFYEIHYVLIINLDKKTAFEIPAHQFLPTGLPGLHDPHTDLLHEAFISDDETLGEVWDICLRGNKTKKYQALNVDRLLTEAGTREYFVSRVDLHCACPSCAPFDNGFWDFEPDVPWEPWIPPVIRIPEVIDPPPNGGGGNTGNPPPGSPVPFDTPENQPVQPWTFPVTPMDEDSANPDSDLDGGEETGGQCEGLTPGCGPEDFETAMRLKEEIGNQLQNARDIRATDVTTFSGDSETTWGFRYEWNPTAEFNDPCIQELYQAYNSQIAELANGVETLVTEYQALYDEREALRENASNVLQALLYRDNLWSNMLEVHGKWHDVEPEPCMPPWIPAGGNPFEDPTGSAFVVIGAELQAKFYKIVSYAMMNHKTFDEAVEEAINSRDCYPNNDPDDPDTRPRATVYKDDVFVMIWKQYAGCLKRLYAKIARNYMNMVYGGDQPLPEEDLNKKIAVLLDGSAALSPSDRAANETLVSEMERINGRLKELAAETTAKRNEIDRLRREFRKKALDCFKPSLENIRRLRSASWILQAFLVWCENPDAEDAMPMYVDLERFCSVLRELAGNPEAETAPKLKAYISMLINCNC